jgi:hypothetical protein
MRAAVVRAIGNKGSQKAIIDRLDWLHEAATRVAAGGQPARFLADVDAS